LGVRQIQWYHEDHLIRPSKKHEIKLTKDGVCSLRVKAATPDDAGTYTCVASNPAGQQTSHATLTVEGIGVDESSYVSQETLRRLMSRCPSVHVFWQ
jgi:Immunoglobulin I-set domain